MARALAPCVPRVGEAPAGHGCRPPNLQHANAANRPECTQGAWGRISSGSSVPLQGQSAGCGTHTAGQFQKLRITVKIFTAI